MRGVGAGGAGAKGKIKEFLPNPQSSIPSPLTINKDKGENSWASKKFCFYWLQQLALPA